MAEGTAEKLRRRASVVGTMLRLVRSPGVVHVARQAGLDFIMLDMEHAPFSFETLAAMTVAARPIGLGVFVRVPELSRAYVSRALDCGADGVMVPMLETVEQARAFVAWAKYPPLGRRGLGSVGGHTDYAKTEAPSRFMADANRRTLTIAQIETAAAIEVVDDIAVVEGIDALLVGPNDLACSLGCPDDPACAAEEEAIEKVARAAASHGKIFGMHAGNALLERWVPRGMRLIVNSLDTSVLADGFRRLAEASENLIQKG